MGVAYKKDIDDVRESPALDIIHLLRCRGTRVTYTDPFVPSVRIDDGERLFAADDHGIVAEADCVVIVTDHSGFNYAKLIETSRLVLDTRNAVKSFSSPKIVRL